MLLRVFQRIRNDDGEVRYEPARERGRYDVRSRCGKSLGLVLTTPFRLTTADLNREPGARFLVYLELVLDGKERDREDAVEIVGTSLDERVEPDEEEREVLLPDRKTASRVYFEVDLRVRTNQSTLFRVVVEDLVLPGYYVVESECHFGESPSSEEL